MLLQSIFDLKFLIYLFLFLFFRFLKYLEAFIEEECFKYFLFFIFMVHYRTVLAVPFRI